MREVYSIGIKWNLHPVPLCKNCVTSEDSFYSKTQFTYLWNRNNKCTSLTGLPWGWSRITHVRANRIPHAIPLACVKVPVSDRNDHHHHQSHHNKIYRHKHGVRSFWNWLVLRIFILPLVVNATSYIYETK